MIGHADCTLDEEKSSSVVLYVEDQIHEKQDQHQNQDHESNHNAQCLGVFQEP